MRSSSQSGCSSAAVHSHSLNESACDSVYGSAPPVPASVVASAESVFSGFCSGAVTMSLSRARVSATYRMRISSLTASLRCAIRTARWGTVEYSPPSPSARRFMPSPSDGWNSTGLEVSRRLNRRAVSARMTTGNSSPLERWMVIMETAPSGSTGVPPLCTAPLSTALSTTRRNAASPPAPPRSTPAAQAVNARSVSRRAGPFSIAPTAAK